MPTKVYPSGDNVIIDQTGTPLLTISQERAKYIILQPATSEDGITPPTPTYIQFLDYLKVDIRTELIEDVQDFSGGTFADLDDLKKYLLFVLRSETKLVDNPDNKISAYEIGNSTKVLLGASDTFLGNWEDVTKWTTVGVSIAGDNSTNGTLLIETSNEKSGIPLETSISYNISAASFDIPKLWNLIEQYVRITYINGTTAQTGFFVIATKYSNGQSMDILHIMGDSIGIDTTGSVHKAVLTGLDQDNNFENIRSSRAGGLHSTITDPDTGTGAFVTAGGSLKTAEQTHLVGSPFGGSALSTDEWDIQLGGSGTQDASVPGQLTMTTGTTANSFSKIQSQDVARFIPANYNTTHHAVTIHDGASYETDNIRKWGGMNAATGLINGLYFELDSGVWYVVHCINDVSTRIIQGSWNGAGALSFPNNSISANVYEIEYNAGSIIYRVNNNVMHRATLLDTPYANNIHFNVGMSNENINGNTTDVHLHLRAAAIYTLGKGFGSARPKFLTGTSSTLIKAGPGKLDRIIFARSGGGGSAATISIYDGLSAVNQIGEIDISRNDTIPIVYDLVFNIGLFIVIAGTGTLGTTITFD